MEKFYFLVFLQTISFWIWGKWVGGGMGGGGDVKMSALKNGLRRPTEGVGRADKRF